MVFNIHLHAKDIEILYKLQHFFGVGHVTLHGVACMYQVVKVSDLVTIIKHFDNYPLKTKKLADFLLFKLAFNIVKVKDHLTEQGLEKLVNIRASLNKGLPERLSFAFTNVIPVPKPKIPMVNIDLNTSGIKHWFAGFVSAEGCFHVKISKSTTHKLGKSVSLNFLVTQHSIDSKLLESFSQILGCGNYYVKESSGVGTFIITGFNNILDKVIPFFEEYTVLGVKAEDYKDFKEASTLIKTKAHLTQEGFNKILFIKSRMNSKR